MNKKTNKPLRILWFVNTPSLAAEKFGISKSSSGSWISATELAMSKRKDIVLAIAFLRPGEKTRRFIYCRRTYYVIRQKDHLLSFFSWLNRITHSISLCKMKDLLWVIDDFKPDLIHIYGSEGPFGLVTKQTKVPIVIRLQGIVQILKEVWGRNISMQNMLFKSGVDCLVSGYGAYHMYFTYGRIAARERKIFKMNRYYIGQTDWDKGLINILSPQSKYFRLNPVVREIFLKKRQQPKKSGKRFSILSIISPNAYKGFEEVLKVAKILKQQRIRFAWRIAGTAHDHYFIKFFERISRNGFAKNNIRFLGILDEKKLVDIFLKSDIYVHPSHIENECFSAIEAMLLGIPVVCYFVGGIGTYIKDGKTGLMVQDSDVFSLAAKIILLKNNPRQAKLLSERARQMALKTFNTVSTINRLINIYKEILKLERKKIP